MSIVFLLIGVFVLVCTIGKFPFYWDSRKAMRLRKLIGDGATSIVYYVIGLILIIVGILEYLGYISLQ